jgi:dTDP-4-amino-4,6-dideoxygalactose transaminase
LGYQEGSLPETDQATREVLALPIFPELTLGQLETVVSTIRQFYEKQ